MKILCVFGENAYGDSSRGASYEKVNFLTAFLGLGHDVSLFDSFSRGEDSDFAALNLRFLRHVDDYRPDLIFTVLMSYEIWTETLDAVRAGSPALIVNWGTDDSWKFNQVSRFLLPHLDFHITTDRDAAAQAQSAGFKNVILSQWAASRAQLLEPLPSSQCEYDVSFVGHLYGDRRGWIEGLRQRGIKVTTFGQGSDGGVVTSSAIGDIYRKSRISLNFSLSGLHLMGVRLKRSRQIKARVFEVPGAGGVLVTLAVAGLSDYFRVGEEIDTFERLDDLAAKAEFYLTNPDIRDRMAWAGHRRAIAEHTYDCRFRDLLALVFANAAPERTQRRWQIETTQIQRLSERHRDMTKIWPLRVATEAVARQFVGKERSGRAARRMVFEASWRLAGERTFGAAGVPGRLFFRES
jgi:spore maturation protein CgeB